jgi:competence protein ComEA
MLVLASMAGWAPPQAFAADRPAAAQDSKALVNVNTASAGDLAKIKGIGDSLAEAIVEHRKQSGPFQKVEDLLQVKGIGDKKLAKIKSQLTVQ